MLSFMIQGLQGGLASGSPRYDSQGQDLEVFSITAAHILVVGNLLPLYRDAGKCLKCSCISQDLPKGGNQNMEVCFSVISNVYV